MKSRQKHLGGFLKKSILKILIVIVVLFNSFLTTAFLPSVKEAQAASYSGQLDVTNPSIDTTQEFGIWVDRTRIILYNATDPQADDMVDALYTATPLDEGINPSESITYKNDAGEGCRSLTVNASQTSGTLRKCGGDEVTVTLKNRQDAQIDGFYYEGGEQIEMPRFVGGIDNCGTGGNVTAKYLRAGIFNKDGNEYRETEKSSTDHDEKTYISDSDIDGDRGDGGDRVLTAKQRRKSTYGLPGATLQNCTIGYANDRNNDPREIKLLNGYTQREVTAAAQAKADEFNAARGRLRLLTAYFVANPDSVSVLQECGRATGQGTDLTVLTKYLAKNYTPDNPSIGDPFIDCALRELGDDADFAAALEYDFEGNYDDSIVSDSASDCGDGGIPIISDVACWLVGWVFDALHAGFSAVIEYLAAPPDMFQEQNSTLEQSMKNLRNIANLIFVIAFLFVVFQYMTNINVVDAYFVKKFIPRLVIAVILVQASFFIVSELNYFFYDLGSSIQTIVFQGNDVGDLVVNNGAATLALAAGLALGPALIGLFLVIGLILLIVLLITMIVLAIRYVLIIVLAILAPIAFAALAIPQLEGMTKKWFMMYIKLLLMYPMIMFFLAASAVVAGALNGGGIILQIISLVAAFLPFIILPFTFKFAGGIMGTISAKLGNLAKKGAKYGIGKGKEAYGRSNYKMGKDYEKEQDRKRKQSDAQARKRAQYLDPNARVGRRGRAIRSDPRAMAELQAEQAQHELQPQIAAERLRKTQQAAEAQRLAEEQRAITNHVRGGGSYVDRNGKTHANERDASLAYLADQAAANARLGTAEGMDNANVAMAQLLADGGDTPFAGEVRDTLGAGSAQWDALRTANYTPLAATRADLAAGPGKTGFDVASTVKKLSTQKKEFWEGALRGPGTLDALSKIASVEAAGGASRSDLTMSSTEAAAEVSTAINAGAADLGRATKEQLDTAKSAIEARVKQLSGDPSTVGTAAHTAATRAMLEVNNELARR